MLGQLILKAMNDRDNRKINQLLGLWGVRWERANLFENRMECLIVANHNVGLERLFAGTRWAAGGWQQALAYLGCAPSKTCRFGGVNSRGLIIPQEHWPGKVESIAFLKLTA